MVSLYVRYWIGLEDHFRVHKRILSDHTIVFRQAYCRNNQANQVKTLRSIFGESAFIDDRGLHISLYNYDREPFRAVVNYLYGVGNILECGIITANSETHIRAIHRLASQMGVLRFMDKAVDELYRGSARSARDLNSTDIDWIYIDGDCPGDRKLREHAVAHGVCRVATVYVTIGNNSIKAGRFFYDCSPQAWRDIIEVLVNYRKFLDKDATDYSAPDPNRPPGPCAYHLHRESVPIQTTKTIKREDAAEVENSAFSQEIQMKIEEDSTAEEEVAGRWTIKNKREYMTVQEEILGGMSDWKRRKLEKMKLGSKFENRKTARREEEDNTFVLKTEQGDLRYTYSTRMEMDVEEQVFKTEPGDLEDHSSFQMDMDMEERDAFIGTSTIRSLGPGRSFLGYPPEHSVNGKGYCGACFVLGSEQGDLGDSSSAVVKMETEENNLVEFVCCWQNRRALWSIRRNIVFRNPT